MARVPAVLFDQVAEQAPEAGVASVRSRRVHQLLRPGGGGRELPVLLPVRAGLVPRLTHRCAGQLGREHAVFDSGQMLEQAAAGQRGRPQPGGQARGVEPVGLPAEGRPQPFQRTAEMLGLAAGHGRLPGGACQDPAGSVSRIVGHQLGKPGAEAARSAATHYRAPAWNPMVEAPDQTTNAKGRCPRRR